MSDFKEIELEINPRGIHSKQILAGFSLLKEEKKKSFNDLPHGAPSISLSMETRLVWQAAECFSLIQKK